MSGDHVVREAAEDAPAFRSAPSALPVKAAPDYLPAFCGCHFSHRFAPFTNLVCRVFLCLRIVKAREISRDGTAGGGDSSVSAGVSAVAGVIRRVF